MRISFDKQKIQDQLDSLKNLPNIKEVKALRKRLREELGKIKEEKPVVTIPKEQRYQQANQRRSSFMKGAWRVVNLLYEKYPQTHEKFGKRQIFTEFFKRRRGLESDIPDAMWQNLSP